MTNLTQIIIQAIFLFLDIIQLIVIIDIILSWLLLFRLNIRPKFIGQILNPIYMQIRKFIPTTIGMIDFTAMIIIFGIEAIKYFLITII